MRHRDFIIGVLLAASATTRKQATLAPESVRAEATPWWHRYARSSGRRFG
jgi:hypothetical protein